MQEIYGFPQAFKPPGNLDFYVISNEDMGFTANLVTGTNDRLTIALPYPASFDIETESLIIHALEFVLQFEHDNSNPSLYLNLMAFLSMLNKTLTATFRGGAADANDEFLKAQFARNIFFGMINAETTATASVEGSQKQLDTVVDAIYFPPVPLDLVTPLFVTFVNQSGVPTLATNAHTDRDFDNPELVQMVAWFTTRKLTPAEKSAREMQIRWQRLDS